MAGRRAFESLSIYSHLLHGRAEAMRLKDYRPVQFRTPAGRVEVRLRAYEITFPELLTVPVPRGGDPFHEFAPGRAEAFVVAAVDRSRHGCSGQLARLHSTRAGD